MKIQLQWTNIPWIISTCKVLCWGQWDACRCVISLPIFGTFTSKLEEAKTHTWMTKCQRGNGVCEAGLLRVNPWQWALFSSSIPVLWDRRSACFRVYRWDGELTSSSGINLDWLNWFRANLVSLVKYWLTMNTDSVLTDGTDNRDFWTALKGLLMIDHASGLEWAAWLTPLAPGLSVISDSTVLPSTSSSVKWG